MSLNDSFCLSLFKQLFPTFTYPTSLLVYDLILLPQALAAAGNLLLYGDERLPAGSAAIIEVAKATQCDHKPPRGRGGGDMTSDSVRSSSNSGASSPTDLVSRLGIKGGGYSDLSASGTARGLLYLQVYLNVCSATVIPDSKSIQWCNMQAVLGYLLV